MPSSSTTIINLSREPGQPAPADIYQGRGAKILKMREEIKKQTIRKRMLQY